MDPVIIGYFLYAMSLLTMGGIYSLLCLGLNAQWGFAGLFNAGIAGFAALGAYAYAILTTEESPLHYGGLGLPLIVGEIAAMAAAGIIAGVIGLICIRLRADYLAIATIGIAEIIKLVIKNETDITNGPRGINKIPRTWEHFSEARFIETWPMSWFDTPEGWEAFFASLPNWWWQPFFAGTVLVFVGIVYLGLERARVSPWGRMMTAIRENEAASGAAGKDVTRRRIEAFVLGAVIMGLGGALLGQHLRLIEPTNTFDPSKMTFLVWVMLIAGGSGNNKGAILGGFLVWFIWSASELVINGAIGLIADILDGTDIGILQTRAGFLRMLLIGLLLQVILQRYPNGILPETRPAAPGKATRAGITGRRSMRKLLLATAVAAMATGAASTGWAQVKIGNPMAVTGPIPDLVKPMAAAVDLAAKHINEQGGMFADGQKLEIVRADSACDPTAAVDAVTKLINVDRVVGIVGPVCSGATIAQAESVSIPAGVVTLSVSASSPAISTMESGTDLVFRAAASDAYQGVALADLAVASGMMELAVAYANDDYNAAIAKVFAKEYEARGGKIVAMEAHEPNKASYRSEVATLGKNTANMALFAYYGSGGITILRNALETGAFDSFLGADGMLAQEVIDQIGAENLENAIFTTSASDDSTNAFAAWKTLAEAADVPPSDPFVPNAYDATFMMALAIEKAGSADPKLIAAALREVANGPGEIILPGEWAKAKALIAEGKDIDYVGGAGPQDFDENGDVAGNFSKSTVVDGKWKAELIK